MVSTHLKNISRIGSFPQVGMKINNIWNHHLVLHPKNSCPAGFRDRFTIVRNRWLFISPIWPGKKSSYLPKGVGWISSIETHSTSRTSQKQKVLESQMRYNKNRNCIQSRPRFRKNVREKHPPERLTKLVFRYGMLIRSGSVAGFLHDVSLLREFSFPDVFWWNVPRHLAIWADHHHPQHKTQKKTQRKRCRENGCYPDILPWR